MTIRSDKGQRIRRIQNLLKRFVLDECTKELEYYNLSKTVKMNTVGIKGLLALSGGVDSSVVATLLVGIGKSCRS